VDKQRRLLRFLTRLRKELGGDAFDIVDRWDADLCAVGIASPSNHAVLAYISTWRMPPGRITVHLELPATPGSDMPYTPGAEYDAVTTEEAISIIAAHLFGSP
jgi:hypothetical protein